MTRLDAQAADARTRLAFINLLREMHALAIAGRLPQPMMLSVCRSLDPVVTSMRQAAGMPVDAAAMSRKRASARRLLVDDEVA